MRTNKTLYVQVGSLLEQKTLFRTSGYYQGVFLKANLVSSFSAGTYSFLQRLSKSYFIDPQTYIYAIDPKLLANEDDEGPRQVFMDLAEKYSPVFVDALSKKKPVDITRLSSAEITLIAENVINYQKECFKSVQEEDYFTELLREMTSVTLEFPVAPYFFITKDKFSAILKVNLELIEKSLTVESKIACFVPITEEVLNDNQLIKDLAKSYSEAKSSCFIIWLDNVDEMKMTEKGLKNFLHLIKSLSSVGRVINYYGGYLSSVLTKFGLDSYGYGPGYSESRGYMPVKGMAPTPMFYFMPAHHRYKVDDLLDFFGQIDKEILFKITLDSPVCNELLKSESSIRAAMSEFSKIEKMVRYKVRMRNGEIVERTKAFYTSRSHAIAKFHFLYSKYKEYEFVKKSNLNGIEQQLKLDRDFLSEYDFVHLKDVDKWISKIEVLLNS